MPGYLWCVHTAPTTTILAMGHVSKPQIRALTYAPLTPDVPPTPCRSTPPSTKTRSETHIRRCRVRRKRKRLPSNGSIESDAAVNHRAIHQANYAASLPIEC